MKKTTALSIALALALSLSACGGNGGGSGETEVTAAASTETVKDETTAPHETTAEETTTTEPAVKENSADDFEFEENDGEITITKFKGSGDEVIIPAEINGKPVTVISYDAFKGSEIKSVVIPEGVKTIYSSTFDNCQNLSNIEFPESLAEFKYQTTNDTFFDLSNTSAPFENTPWINAKRAENPIVVVNNLLIDGRTCSRDVEIPEGVTVICDGTFCGCTTVTSVTIPESVEKIGALAFYSCERLAEIVLPDKVNYIGSYAFDRCFALENVTFPNNTVEVGAYIFGSCRGVCFSVAFGGNYVDFLDDMSTFCPWLKNKIRENPLVIVNGNLINGHYCSGDVAIPDSVKSIAEDAFGASFFNSMDCYGNGTMTSVTLPNNITKIPNNLFSGCYALTNVTIPDSVTEIGYSAFNATGISSITIPESVKSIGYYAFSGCQKLQSITIPKGVTEIGDYCFSWCQGVKNVTLPEGLKKIGSHAFEGSGLTELTLPDSLESIAKDALAGCEFDITYKGEVYFPELYDELIKEINGQ